jgi:membrane-associated protein
MHTLADQVQAASFINPKHLLDSFGLAGLLIIIFAECGLLIGFFLPGDTLLFSTGLLLAVGQLKHVPLAVALILLPIAAVLGNVVGYWIGRTAGPKVFDRPNSKMFRPEYVERSHTFFDRFGARTVLVARFVPVVRTVATVLAGVSKMRFSLYLTYSIIGGIIWTDGVTLIGYWLGHIQFVRDKVEPLIDPILVAVVLVSLLPTLIHWWRSRRTPTASHRST